MSTNTVSDCECGYTCGLSLRKCVRVCCVVGMTSAVFYIVAGTTIIVHILQNEEVSFERTGTRNTKAIFYKNNGGFFICLAIVLILVNIIQVVSDIFLLHSTLKVRKGRSLWIFFLLDIILWVMTLIVFTAIFSGGGIFLLLVFLFGTAVRVYIIFILHQYMSDLRKSSDSSSSLPSHTQCKSNEESDT